MTTPKSNNLQHKEGDMLKDTVFHTFDKFIKHYKLEHLVIRPKEQTLIVIPRPGV